MKKPVIGILLGTAVLFVWGAASWMLLPWHSNTIKKFPEEQLVMDTLKTVVTEPGFYFFPSHEGPDGRMDDGAWAMKYKHGPIGVMAFSPAGRTPLGSANFLSEIGSDFIVALVTMMLLCLSRDRVQSTVPRALLVMSIGLVVGMAAHVTYWNWFVFPAGFTVVNIADGLVGFLLLGFSQAKFVPES